MVSQLARPVVAIRFTFGCPNIQPTKYQQARRTQVVFASYKPIRVGSLTSCASPSIYLDISEVFLPSI